MIRLVKLIQQSYFRYEYDEIVPLEQKINLVLDAWLLIMR
jgi:hypothetical protein